MNLNKELKSLLEGLDDTSITTLIDLNNNIIKFYYLDKEKAGNNVCIEKLFDYIEMNKYINKYSDDKIINDYFYVLFSFINGRSVKNTRAYTYMQKADNLKFQFKKRSETSIGELEDFTRIFTCLYIASKYNTQTISDFDFSLVDLDKYKKLRKKLLEAKINKKNENDKYEKFLLLPLIMDVLYLDMLKDYKEV